MPRKKAESKAPRVPEDVVRELAPAYKEWKGGEKAKEKLKAEFFEGITEWIKENGEPEEDYLIVIGTDEKSAEEAAEQERPGWLVEVVRPYLAEGDEVQIADAWEAIVVEDPKYMPFTIDFDGFTYGRQIVEGASMLDNERLEAEDPELWKRVASWPMEGLLGDIAYEAGMHHTDVADYIEMQCKAHGVKRQLKDFEDISDKDAGSLQAYMYIGAPTVKLPAPKKMKEAEIG